MFTIGLAGHCGVIFVHLSAKFGKRRKHLLVSIAKRRLGTGRFLRQASAFYTRAPEEICSYGPLLLLIWALLERSKREGEGDAREAIFLHLQGSPALLSSLCDCV